MGKLKNKIGQEMRWTEEGNGKSTLKWYMLAKDNTGVESFMR